MFHSETCDQAVLSKQIEQIELNTRVNVLTVVLKIKHYLNVCVENKVHGTVLN